MNALEHVDAVIIGGGAVGLACAASLARRMGSVVVLERNGGPGRETSSRNSGVIHAGLYYPPGSLKARLCVEGRERLYEWCQEHDVPHRKTGKLLVATDDVEADKLEKIRKTALENGAGAMQAWDGATVRRHEPQLRAVAGLWSPESGIVDAHGLMDSLLADARSHGADVVWHTRLESLEHDGQGWKLQTVHASGEPYPLRASIVVNAGGLQADRVAELAGIDVDAAGWRLHFCKGDYFVLGSGAPRPQTELVYPVPVQAGLGIHLTTDLGGRCTAGPDTTYVDTLDYAVDGSKTEAFAEAVARYLPGIRPEHLGPDYAGIRPKLAPPGGDFRDFVIEESTPQGAPGMIHLIGIESPGLTASLAIGERVAALAGAG
jgi:L-2-hydroxyglutarate oxidase LhgO